MDFISLPIHLILLVHLHILEYPHANNSEYDHDLFNPRTRGLRERAKTMEDVTYFLVGKTEGKIAKIILPTYPCAQPSESLAFRTSLAKYLEGLRHSSLFPSSTRASGKSSAKPAENISQEKDAGWWWKDIVVRKSLLEECSGEKFQRLILALSTHAIMKSSYSVAADKMSDLIICQPAIYAAQLAQYQAKRHNWTKSASLLLKHEHNLKTLRESIGAPALSKHETLPTERMLAFEAFKRETLLRENWSGKEGAKAFNFLITLAGIQTSTRKKSFSTSALKEEDLDSKITVIPSPLPIAAAHHPSHLKKLRKPVFQSKIKAGPTTPAAPVKSHAEIILAEHFESEKRMRQMLLDALSKAAKMHSQLTSRYENSKTPASPRLNTFWTPPTRLTKSIDFNPIPDRNLMIALGCEQEYATLDMEGDNEDALERKIANIRQVVLPPYPTPPDPLAQRIPAEISKAKPNPKNEISKIKIPHAKVNVGVAAAPKNSENITTVQSRIAAPSTPLMSPGKSSRSLRRKSVRFSMAQKRTDRPSIFRVFSTGKYDEVDRLVDETNDFPTDDEDSDIEQENDDENGSAAFKTPKPIRPKPVINRIWTAGTPKSAAKQAKLRVSSSSLGRLLAVEPEVGLPSMTSMDFEDHDEIVEHQEESDEMSAVKDVDATPRPRKNDLPRRSSSPKVYVSTTGQGERVTYEEEEEEEEEEEYGDGPPSMTLKEILLASDASNFDLLEFDSQDIEEGMLAEDSSFVWE